MTFPVNTGQVSTVVRGIEARLRAVPLAPPARKGPAPRPAVSHPPMAVGFFVVIDKVALPSFSECRGIGVEYAMETWSEGGQNDYLHQLPGRKSYTPITLTRYLDSSSGALAAWFDSANDRAVPYRQASISACDPRGKQLASWTLRDVVPMRYTGPGFASGTPAAASESVELVHHGFTFEYADKTGG